MTLRDRFDYTKYADLGATEPDDVAGVRQHQRRVGMRRAVEAINRATGGPLPGTQTGSAFGLDSTQRVARAYGGAPGFALMDYGPGPVRTGMNDLILQAQTNPYQIREAALRRQGMLPQAVEIPTQEEMDARVAEAQANLPKGHKGEPYRKYTPEQIQAKQAARRAKAGRPQVTEDEQRGFRGYPARVEPGSDEQRALRGHPPKRLEGEGLFQYRARLEAQARDEYVRKWRTGMHGTSIEDRGQAAEQAEPQVPPHIAAEYGAMRRGEDTAAKLLEGQMKALLNRIDEHITASAASQKKYDPKADPVLQALDSRYRQLRTELTQHYRGAEFAGQNLPSPAQVEHVAREDERARTQAEVGEAQTRPAFAKPPKMYEDPQLGEMEVYEGGDRKVNALMDKIFKQFGGHSMTSDSPPVLRKKVDGQWRYLFTTKEGLVVTDERGKILKAPNKNKPKTQWASGRDAP